MSHSVSNIVPIWNVRGKKDFDFQSMVPNLLFNPSLLPRFQGEIPVGSCVVVGYTVNTFTKSGDNLKSVSFNIQFVIVLGTPSE